MIPTRRRMLPGLVLAAVLGGPALAADGAPTLVLPIDCEPGKTCWVVNYVDHDSGDGIDDYMCGKASYNEPPHNRHIGTDIAIRDLAEMRKGVAALAAAPGVVRATRDGVKDVDIKDIGGPAAVKGKECGNGIVVDHPGGWSTQYCHLREGSVRVKKGDRVAAGQPIAMVGLSGLTEFPHVHFTVRKGNDVFDPFVGPEPKQACGLGAKPLWAGDVLAKLPYRPTAIYSLGFVAETPDAKAARDGAYTATNFPAAAPSLVLWTDVFWVQPGDEMLLTVTGPNGAKVFEGRRTVERRLARSFNVAGRPRPPAGWPTGVYTGEVKIVRKDGRQGLEEYSASAEVEILKPTAVAPADLPLSQAATPAEPPATDVTASAETRLAQVKDTLAASANGSEERADKGPLLVGLGAGAVLILVLAVYLARRRRR